MAKNIETFSTGGGIVLAEAILDASRYAVVSSEAPDFLTIYKRTEEPYLPEDMIESVKEDKMTDEFKELYLEMLQALKSA